MRGKVSAHTKTLGFNLDHDPGQIKSVGFYDPELVPRHVFFEANRPKGMLERGLIHFPFCRSRIKTYEPVQTAYQSFPVSNPFGNDAKVIARVVPDKQTAATVKYHTPEGWNVHEMNAIIFRAGPVGRPVYHLKKPQPQDQETKYHQDKQCSASQLPGQDFKGYAIENYGSQRSLLLRE